MMNFLPEAASSHAGDIDQIIVLVHWLMAVLFVGWGAFFIYVLVRFRAGRNPKADYTGVKSKISTYLEVAVAVFEAALLIGFSIPIWAERMDERPPDNEATQVRVVAQQFAWNIWYPGEDGIFGNQDINLVDEETNPSFYRVIQRYEELTGVPVVVNTSFNMHEEPIVCTPGDAVRAYQKGKLDNLAIGSFLLGAPPQE